MKLFIAKSPYSPRSKSPAVNLRHSLILLIPFGHKGVEVREHRQVTEAGKPLDQALEFVANTIRGDIRDLSVDRNHYCNLTSKIE